MTNSDAVTSPLIFIMHGDIQLFKSPSSMIGYCEIDYLAGDYTIFDASGRLLYVKKNGNEYSVHVESELPFYSVELRLELIKYLSRRNRNIKNEQLFRITVDELLALIDLEWI